MCNKYWEMPRRVAQEQCSRVTDRPEMTLNVLKGRKTKIKIKWQLRSGEHLQNLFYCTIYSFALGFAAYLHLAEILSHL